MNKPSRNRVVWLAVIVFLIAGASIGYAAVPQSTVQTTAGGITTYVGHYGNFTESVESSEYFLSSVNITDSLLNADPLGNAIFVAVDTDELTLNDEIEVETNSSLAGKAGYETVIVPRLIPDTYSSHERRVILFQNDTVSYAIQYQGDDLYNSTDSGDTWSLVNNNCPGTFNLLYRTFSGVLIATTPLTTSDIYRSVDNGANWVSVETNVGGGLGPNSITESNNGTILFAAYYNDTSNSVYRSIDDGLNWNVVLTAVSQHFHSVMTDPYDTDKIVAFEDRGGAGPVVWISSNHGGTWADNQATGTTYGYPNYVSLMFFKNYIAWGMDVPADANQGGSFFRIPRDDFYNDIYTNYELIGKVGTGNAVYATREIANDTWIAVVKTEGNTIDPKHGMVPIIYDDASKIVAGVMSSTGSVINLPSTRFNESLDNMVIISNCKQDVSYLISCYLDTSIGGILLDNNVIGTMGSLYGRTMGEESFPVIELSAGSVKFGWMESGNEVYINMNPSNNRISLTGGDLRLEGNTLYLVDGEISNAHWSDRITLKNFINLVAMGASPGTPQNGDVVYADGATWDPGNGSGAYLYDNASWCYLGGAGVN